MKKILILCVVLSLLLSSCTVTEPLAIYTGGDVPSDFTPLYPGTSGTEYAVLLRKYDSFISSIAVTEYLGAPLETVYTASDTSAIYEIYAKDGIIAFYELTSYEDGTVGYELNVLEYGSRETVHHDNVYQKTVTREGDVQTRFLAIHDGAVYYLTASLLLERSRIMRYDVETKELTEYISFPMTENELTYGHPCTFIRETNGYLVCGYAEGDTQYIRTYNLRSGALHAEKRLPDYADIVYFADHDPDTGIYALYYGTKSGDSVKEYIAFTTSADTELHNIFEAGDNIYIVSERVSLCNNVIYFNTDELSGDDPYKAYNGLMYNITDGSAVSFSGSCRIRIDGYSVYNITFDKRKGFEKVYLREAEIQ